MAALYRKYRPQDFDEVVGQEAVVRTLRNAIARGQVRQAYLFAGPRGTGKTSLARILAKALNCAQGPTPTPGQDVPRLRAIADGTSLDVIEMDAASQRGIDDIREIRERVVLQPVEGRYKVYILDEAHQLTDAAWNALLKLIEEPPPHLVFVFCTTDLAKVLPTVRSRCQTFVFSRPRLPELVAAAAAGRRRRGDRRAGRGALADRARRARRVPRRRLDARPARGRDRAARSPCRPCSSCSARSRRRRSSASATSIVDRDTAGALTFVEELSEQGQDLGRLVTDLLEHLRHLLLVQHMGEVPDVAARDRGDARAAARAGEPARRGDRAAALRPARRRRRRHAPGRRPAAAARARAREGDAAGRRSLARVDSPTASSSSRARRPGGRQAPAPRRATAPAPKRAASQAAGRAGRARRRSSSSSSRRPGSARSLPAVERALDPDRVDARARRTRGARRRHADRRVPARAPRSTGSSRRSRRTRRCSRDALYEVTGRRLALAFALGENGAEAEPEADEPASEEEIVELIKETFDAREVEERANEHGHEQADAAGAADAGRRWRKAQEELANEIVEASAGGGHGHRHGDRRRRDHRDQDRPEGDRPGRPGDARGHRRSPP